MDPRLRNYLEDERRWSLAAEVAASLAEITRWEWSEHADEAARLALRLADGIYQG